MTDVPMGAPLGGSAAHDELHPDRHNRQPSPRKMARALVLDASRSSRMIPFWVRRPIVTIGKRSGCGAALGTLQTTAGIAPPGPSSGFPSQTAVAALSTIMDRRCPSL